MEQVQENGEKVPLPSYTYSGTFELQNVDIRGEVPIYDKSGWTYDYKFLNNGVVNQAHVSGRMGQDFNGNPNFSSIGSGIENNGRIKQVWGQYNYDTGYTWLTNQENGFVEMVENMGTITNQDGAVINSAGGGRIINKDNAYIGGAGGYLVTNQDKASIGTAVIGRDSQSSLQNTDEASIGSLYVGYSLNGYDSYTNRAIYSPSNSDASAGNLGNASIGAAYVNGGLTNSQNASIGTVDVRGGRVVNDVNASIGTAHVSENGSLMNTGNATIENAFVVNTNDQNRTSILNTGNASIGSLSVQRAKVVNEAAIGNASVQINGLLNNVNGSIDTVSIIKGRVNNGTNASIGKVSIIDGGILDNTAGPPAEYFSGPTGNTSIGTVTVTGSGTVWNNSGAIDNISISGHGFIDNLNGASVNTVSITDGGRMNNRNNSFVGKVSVDGNGSGANVINSARMGEVNVIGWGGVVNNTDSMISNITVSDNGGIHNNGLIGRANISDFGKVGNYGGTIDSAIVDGGFLDTDGMTRNLRQNGGVITNGGRIENMTYSNGTYNAASNGAQGTIGTLLVAGNLVGENWGNIDNLVFADNGSGILSIKAFASESAETTTFRTMSASAAPTADISFASVNADNIDLTYGNVVLDLSTLGADESAFMNEFEGGFTLASLLNRDEASVSGILNSFEVAMETGITMGAEMFEFISNGLMRSGMSFSSTDAGYVWTAAEAPTTPTPEPATLVMLGLGLASLGLARRRK